MNQNCLTIVSQSRFDLIGEFSNVSMMTVCANLGLPPTGSLVPTDTFVLTDGLDVRWTIHLALIGIHDPKILSPVVQSVSVSVIDLQRGIWKTHQQPVQLHVPFSKLQCLSFSQTRTGIPDLTQRASTGGVPFETTDQREVIVVNESNETTRKENFFHP